MSTGRFCQSEGAPAWQGHIPQGVYLRRTRTPCTRLHHTSQESDEHPGRSGTRGPNWFSARRSALAPYSSPLCRSWRCPPGRRTTPVRPPGPTSSRSLLRIDRKRVVAAKCRKTRTTPARPRNPGRCRCRLSPNVIPPIPHRKPNAHVQNNACGGDWRMTVHASGANTAAAMAGATIQLNTPPRARRFPKANPAPACTAGKSWRPQDHRRRAGQHLKAQQSKNP